MEESKSIQEVNNNVNGLAHAQVGYDAITGCEDGGLWQDYPMNDGLDFPASPANPLNINHTTPGQRIQELLEGDDEFRTHHLFCEMEVLRDVADEDLEWRETSRWLMFEESVEEGGERWSKPYVTTLALQSLFGLRKGLVSGTVILDLEADTLPEILNTILDSMISTNQIAEKQRDELKEVLLAPHRHHHVRHEKKGLRGFMDIGCKQTPKEGFNDHFAKKVPAGAEACNILVGEVKFLEYPVLAFVRRAEANILGNMTEVYVPTRFIFILLGPPGSIKKYADIARAVGCLMTDEIFRVVAYRAKKQEDLLTGIDEFLEQVILLPPGKWDPRVRIEPPQMIPSQQLRKTGEAGNDSLDDEGNDETLERTGRLFGGMIKDIRRKSKFYLSDFRDALSIQCLATVFFMYFACLTPMITFGGILGHATGNNMAAMETVLAGAMCGITFHLFSGQPLTIVGSTGPVLVFETIVYHFCTDNKLDYLAMRFWIGIWVSVLLIIVVAFDLSSLVKYITRFTEESFASLIALIFIVGAFKKLFHILDHDMVDLNPNIIKDYQCECLPTNITMDGNMSTLPPTTTTTTLAPLSNATNMTSFPGMSSLPLDQCVAAGGFLMGSGCNTPHYVADVFFFSCIIFLGTYVLATSLRQFKTAPFFPTFVRSFVSDFAVVLAIVCMVGFDALVGLNTPKLHVPEEFAPTLKGRGWFVNPLVNPSWCIAAGILPAIPATILIFMDQQITAVIVNRKENELKKSCGYHLDLFVIALQISVCSIMGIPWFVAATVESMTHVRALVKESECAAPGEKPQFLGIREQRATGVMVYILVGLSVLMTPFLSHIPMPVLYGIFLFMGVNALRNSQLLQRIALMFMPGKWQPDLVFLRHVPLRRVHMYTCIQILCVVALWVIKTVKSISIIFPLKVLTLCFIRKALDYVFTQHELEWLDDILPESKKKENEDRFHRKSTGERSALFNLAQAGGAFVFPIDGGQSITVAIDKITYDPHTRSINIIDKTGNTATLKHLVSATLDSIDAPDAGQEGLRKRKPSVIFSTDIKDREERKSLMADVKEEDSPV